MSEKITEARDFIAERAIELAREEKDPDKLEALSRAVGNVHFGPQGANYTYHGERTDKIDYRYTAKYQYGPEREQPAGFRAPEEPHDRHP